MRLSRYGEAVGTVRLAWLMASALVYVVLAGYQLGLPGLHYDEAKEAGVNAMELIIGAPVTAFRDATVKLTRSRLPIVRSCLVWS